jgi:hypothetical protein
LPIHRQKVDIHSSGQQSAQTAPLSFSQSCHTLNNCLKARRRGIMAAKTSRADFESVFPSLMEDVLDNARKFNVPQNALDWFEKV